MACCWVEGFEAHRISGHFARKYASMTGYASTMSGTGRVHGTAGTFVSPTISAFDNTFIIGFGMNLSAHTAGVNTATLGFYAERSGAEQCHLEFESTNGVGIRVQLYRGATLIASSAYMSFNTWYYFEAKLTVRDGTDGAYEFKINGAADTSGSSVNLGATAADGWSEFAIRSNSNITTLLIDDIYVLDSTGSSNNDFLGDRIVEMVSVTANGATNQWTPLTVGNGYQDVDDAANATPDDSGAGGYVSVDANNQTELYTFSDLVTIVGTVNAVMVTVQAAMASAGSRNCLHVARDGDGFSVASTTYAGFNMMYEENPALAAPWDIDGVNDIQFGFRTET
jgi:hypothetical protein